MSDAKLTPMMQQYMDVKDKYDDHIVFFRMGDFYEMFGEDAVEASKILGIALTSRDKKKDDGIPMCGIPYHSYKSYLIKLIDAGRKVAVCEQLEDPKEAKGIVKRGVTQVITPGTVIDDEALNAASNNYFCAVHKGADGVFVSAVDISTGDVFVEECAEENLSEILRRWAPSEVISDADIFASGFDLSLVDYSLTPSGAEKKVCTHYSSGTAKSIGLDKTGYVYSLALALTYFERNMAEVRLKKPSVFVPEDRLNIDTIAASTLELVKNLSDGSERNTLFSVLHSCKTAMGSRLLKKWLLHPLRNIDTIRSRHEMVEYLTLNFDTAAALRELLSGVYDLERIMTRLLAARCSPRDLIWLKNSIKVFPEIKQTLKDTGFIHFQELSEIFDDLGELYTLIDDAIADDAPLTFKDGGVIKDGFSKEIDELRLIKQDSRKLLAGIESQERERTGISNLKIKYNKVFGYYIEISKSNLNRAPVDYERKQTLVNAERFIIPELKELELKIVHADGRLNTLEQDIFSSVRDEAADFCDIMRESAGIVSEIDCLLSFADAAVKNKYMRPEMHDGSEIVVSAGRHPVVEKNITDRFVPNDLELGTDEARMLVITGPNMAGKSTYLRTTALITLMAHAGSFVPADKAKIALVDRIFTRVGASDNLAAGESTFMVEMVETANILNNATNKSLIVLDEIGRGTSTFDGVSIAWSVAEYILNTIGAKTLFATHYHELTDIAHTNGGALNCTTSVQEWNDELVFMRKVIPGSADRSYGIHVAKLAGLPKPVVERGFEILESLEKNEFGADGIPKLAKSRKKKEERVVTPMLIFEDHPVLEELRSVDINNMTPMDALTYVNKLKERLKE